MTLEEEILAIKRISNFHREKKDESNLIKFYTWCEEHSSGLTYATHNFCVSVDIEFARRSAKVNFCKLWEGYVDSKKLHSAGSKQYMLCLERDEKILLTFIEKPK